MEQKLGHLVTLLSRTMSQQISAELEPLHITFGETPFYIALARNDGLTQEELSTIVGVNKSSTTRAVKSLESKRMLWRESCARDKRCNLLHLTEDARKLYEPILEILDHYNAGLVAFLGKEEYERVYQSLSAISAFLLENGKSPGSVCSEFKRV